VVTLLNQEEVEQFMKLLIDVIAMSYKHVPRIDKEITKHKIPLYPDGKPFK